MKDKKEILKLQELKKKLKKCQKENDEYLKGWQRAKADFLNYKKEETEKRGEILKYANENLIFEILPVLDNLKRAENEIPKNMENNKIIEGFLQIRKQLDDFLKSHGVEEIKCLGEKFDPNFQEVIEEVEKDGKESGIIIEESQKGYKIYGRVIRPAKVKIIK